MSSLQAFPRADGSVGIRNIVLVVSTVTCANTVVNHIAWKTGAVPLTHERGCVEGEQSFRRTMLALTTFAKHPNVSGVLIVGLGCGRSGRLTCRSPSAAASRARHPHSGGRIVENRGQRLCRPRDAAGRAGSGTALPLVRACCGRAVRRFRRTTAIAEHGYRDHDRSRDRRAVPCSCRFRHSGL
ncbi:MAG: UxaA family hydrolase [Bilophila wadsworthia]